jgi:hypothetical protein
MSETGDRILHPSADVARADWVIAEIGRAMTVAGIMPPRFAAYARIAHRADGQDSEPAFGRMDVAELAAVAAILARHTTTPGDCVATLWEGHGELHPSSTTVLTGEERWPRRRVSPSDPVHSLISAALANPRVRLPFRDSLLFTLDLVALTDPAWSDASGWRQRPFDSLTPQTLWPEDRAWFLASEIDFQSTFVGGSAELIADLIVLASTGAIEAVEVSAAAELTPNGEVTGLPAHS